MHVEWDESKSSGNERKHGVSFPEASTVFFDEHAVVIHDPDHSEREDRFVMIGLSRSGRELVVCHCYREHDELESIRIISARKANRQETQDYWSMR